MSTIYKTHTQVPSAGCITVRDPMANQVPFGMLVGAVFAGAVIALIILKIKKFIRNSRKGRGI